MKKVALITGVTGQDGAYLSEFLLNKNYIVHGVRRRSSIFNTQRIDFLINGSHEKNKNFHLHYGDLTDSMNIINIIRDTKPDEIYNLAAMSHVHISFDIPEYTANVDALGTLRIVEAVRILGYKNKTKIYQASTSELYGKVQEIPQTERTPFYPRSPYGVAKLYGFWITKNYREAYDLFACNGILFNHESPIRGETFVTRKITRAVSEIVNGKDKVLNLGNLDSKRDWGHARDYIEGMWLMLQQDKAEDYVLATGEANTVRDFVKYSFLECGIEIEFEGKDEKEIARVKNCFGNYKIEKNKIVVKVNPKYYRPAEVDILIGDYSKAKKDLGWSPKISFRDLIKEMMKNDLKTMKNV